MAPDRAGEDESASRRERPRTGPGRVILGWIFAYALALALAALAGYDDAATALWLPAGALVGYALGYLVSRSPGRRGESVANLFFFAALGVLMIFAVVIVVSPPAGMSAPWLALLGFVPGVVAASYVRLKHPRKGSGAFPKG